MNQNITSKYLIIGGGPAGLQMGYFMEKNDKDYIILEKSSTAGSFFKTQPIHRKLLSINKKYNFFEEEEFNWRHDWNSLLCDEPEMRFTKYTDDLFPHADVLVDYLEDFAKFHKLKIEFNTEVANMSKKKDGGFLVTTTAGVNYECEVLLLGLGAVKEALPDDIEGIELTTSYDDQSVDLETYRNKRVGIIGGGNSAFETASYLSGVAGFVHVLAKTPPRMAWDTHFPGDIRAVNNDIFDMYQLKSMHAVLTPRIKKVVALPGGLLETHHEYDYPKSKIPGTLKLTREYDHIIRCTGWKWVDETLFAEDTVPETKAKGKYPSMKPTWESNNIDDMYFIGGAMQGNDRKAASGFIHGFRYNIRSCYHLLDEKYDSNTYPTMHMKPFDWEKFLELLYDRMSMSAALFQLYGTMGDLVTFSEDLSEATWQQEFPMGYMADMIKPKQHSLVMSLEFGFHHYDESSLNFLGPSDPNDTKCAAFLHPVIRHHYDGKIEEFHFGDSLLGRWDMPHGKGGAVVSYHLDFQKWVKEMVGLDIMIPEGVEGGPFHKWPMDDMPMDDMKSSESETD
ncbi:MAG: hypothetical protein ACI8WB_003658 [Phenylobacterium sp.]|jgi:hypothetical protein